VCVGGGGGVLAIFSHRELTMCADNCLHAEVCVRLPWHLIYLKGRRGFFFFTKSPYGAEFIFISDLTHTHTHTHTHTPYLVSIAK